MIEWRPRGWRMLEWRPSVGLDVGGALLAVGAGTIAVALSTTGAGAAHLGQAIGAPTQTVTVSTSGAGATAPFMAAAGAATQSVALGTVGAGSAHLGTAIGAPTQTIGLATVGAGAAHLGQAAGAPTQTISFATAGAGVTAPFRLHDLPNCVVSIRPRVATVTLNGADVSQVDDETGLGHHVVQATASKQPLWVASGGPNNKSYVEFDGVDESLRAAFTLAKPAHVFFVGKPSVAPNANDYFIDGGTAGTMALGLAVVPDRIIQYAGAFLYAATTLTNFQRINALFNGASSFEQVNAGAPVTGNAGAGVPGGLTIGAFGDEAQRWADPQVCEVVVFSAEVTGNAKTLATWYVATEYSL